MSQTRAIAAVSRTLYNMLTESVRDFSGAGVRIGPPQTFAPHEITQGLINIFLFHVQPNATWRNREMPFRGPDGTLIRRPMLALDLHYLLSFYGEPNRATAELLLGRTLTALHIDSRPHPRFIPSEASEAANRAAPDADDLTGSGLSKQIGNLSFNPLPLTIAELSSLWTLFHQVPYTTSVGYSASVLLIEPELDIGPPAPRPEKVTLTVGSIRDGAASLEEVPADADRIEAELGDDRTISDNGSGG